MTGRYSATRCAIAKACGWRYEPKGMACDEYRGWVAPDGSRHLDCPDYFNDLNAMHEAEMMTFRSIAAMERYRTMLHLVLAENFAVELDFCAPAKWRAEAFLRTLKK